MMQRRSIGPSQHVARITRPRAAAHPQHRTGGAARRDRLFFTPTSRSATCRSCCSTRSATSPHAPHHRTVPHRTAPHCSAAISFTLLFSLVRLTALRCSAEAEVRSPARCSILSSFGVAALRCAATCGALAAARNWRRADLHCGAPVAGRRTPGLLLPFQSILCWIICADSFPPLSSARPNSFRRDPILSYPPAPLLDRTAALTLAAFPHVRRRSEPPALRGDQQRRDRVSLL